MKFCPACGGTITSLIPEKDERERFVCTVCGTVHYVNPKIIVGAVCTFGERVLLCRRAIEPRLGYWTIPAGFMELGETAEEGARREAFEEARADIAICGLLAVYSIKRINQVHLLYRARLLDERVAPGIESLEVKLAHWHEIPWTDLAFPSVDWALRKGQEVLAQNPAEEESLASFSR